MGAIIRIIGRNRFIVLIKIDAGNVPTGRGKDGFPNGARCIVEPSQCDLAGIVWF